MSKKNLTVRFESEAFNLTLSDEELANYTNWLSKANHGIYNPETLELICMTSNDFIYCRVKAKKSGLMPVIRTRSELIAAQAARSSCS